MANTNPFSLEGKIALVTGASYGIGFAIAKAMAGAGATIVFNDIKQDLVDKGVAAYKEEGIEAHGYVCDVTNEEAVNSMVEAIEKEVGVIDILVNNAGIIKRIPMCEMTAAEFRQVIDVDLNAPFIVSKAVIPSMETPQTAPLRERQPDGSRHPFDTFICAKTPANRWLQPEELGGPAVFLASEASNGVNGHILYVDGGILAYIGKQPK